MTADRKFIHLDVRKNIVSYFLYQGHAAMKSGSFNHQKEKIA